MKSKPLVSIVIITMNRKLELDETLINIYEQTYENIEVILYDNGSRTEIYNHNLNLSKNYNSCHFYSSPKNLGVSGGRTEALKKAIGKYIIEIDDDAIFEDTDAIEKAINFMISNTEIGIAAFKIVNFHTRTVTRNEYPFRDKSRLHSESGYCTWFIGAGHCFRRETISTVGYYNEYFPWGLEEHDYSLRALDNNFLIYFLADVIVLHKKSPNARIKNPIEFASIQLKNQIKVAAINLPLLSIVSYIILRSLQAIIKNKNIMIPFLALRYIYHESDYIRRKRKVIDKKTIEYLKRNHGQLYY
jgi:GT2 family glycosyltransferase